MTGTPDGTKATDPTTLVAFWLLLLGLGSCTTRPETLAEQMADGEALFNHYCQDCHTESIGPKFDSAMLAKRGTPLGLYDYLRLSMPYDNPGVLRNNDYWDVVAFMLREYGLRMSQTVLTSGNADDPLQTDP